MITLDENFTIKTDAYNWTLVYDKVTPTVQEDGSTKDVRSYDEWHYPSLALCLKKYMNQALKVCESIEHLHAKCDSMELWAMNFKPELI